ncbi:hypothetical protein GCM10025865_32200 [Paraoerskovia sediminicola]|uniref:DUF4439 domain-containing protein n=1 Tax=Paraoerskovia sediminicola TaxID=1138587 RepID=A0ABM8G6Z4_9CELL|nr:DUF4439 domain-containing protein [Paraoerskovia sediminicola]BDZ43921.1 hypothetical protein GCM10025865_32200 [Paraoerskovia sediminicola]
MIASEDASGYAYEVLAARDEGAARKRAVALAATHRARAQRWAEVVEVEGTAQDPREVAYGLTNVDDTAVVGIDLESSLAATYSTLVGQATAVERATLVDLLAESARAAEAWGAPAAAFPGMPERAAD